MWGDRFMTITRVAILVWGVALAMGSALAPAGSVARAQASEAVTSGEAMPAPGWGTMDDAERARAIAYSGTKHTFFFVTALWSALVLVFLLYSGLSGRVWNWARKAGRVRVFALGIYVLLFLIVTALFSLPFTYYIEFHLEHQYGLSNQTLGAWLTDGVKSLLVSWVFLTLVAGILFALVRAYPRAWWAWLTVVAIPLLIFVVIIAPIVITPLFYETTPMEEGPLRAQILDLAAQSGIPDSRVFVMNASKDTEKLSAYVTGLGQTKRIVLYDNLVAKMEAPEVLFVVGHEMGHYLLHHVWIGLGIVIVVIGILAYLSHLVMGRLVRRNERRFGFDRLSSPASLPLFGLCFSVLGFFLMPVQNGLWRYFEHQADVFGLDRTGNGQVAAGAFEKLAAVNLVNPNPSGFVKFWLYDHPTLSERVRFARAYEPSSESAPTLRFLGERRLANIRQLTFGGENAEAYFDARGERLVFQSTRDGHGCDRIYTMDLAGGDIREVSAPGGVKTCAFFAPDGERIIYCSTHLVDDTCPPKPPRDKGYVWALYAGYDVFSANPDGSGLVRLTDTPGYDAEAVYAPDGSKILFTSVRDGDLELYTMDPDGSNQTRITFDLGYDGGAFFSADSRRIVYRAHHPESPEEVADYQELLRTGLIRPSRLEIFVMDADGSNRTQVTRNGAANFCPYFHPNGREIVFASNMDDPNRRNFELYLINTDGTGLERLTYNDTFDGFPMFNHDGTKLVFASNRHGSRPGETNIFIADWMD